MYAQPPRGAEDAKDLRAVHPASVFTFDATRCGRLKLQRERLLRLFFRSVPSTNDVSACVLSNEKLSALCGYVVLLAGIENRV